ncbi:uncharacterized protein LOC128265739 isoform X1 [Drosophila gunungcola]|uniref:uncharacterized protein LOC128265739 isoform X1 n=1 Tax=Drosophila gunungcola TaxID=103775 RepID=UPI0022E0D67C|nr:uncharacterized protein LOC128265739 isoform X1 [Drosophila gunungcola]
MKKNKSIKIPQDIPATGVARHFEERSLDGDRPQAAAHPPRTSPAAQARRPAPQSFPARERGVPAGATLPARPPLASDRPTSIRQLKKQVALPALGQPGGLDDPNRRGLPGSKVKWYLRYLMQGMTPEEALKKAKEPREQPELGAAPAGKRLNTSRTPPTDTPKRSRHGTGASETSSRVPGQEGPSTAAAAAEKAKVQARKIPFQPHQNQKPKTAGGRPSSSATPVIGPRPTYAEAAKKATLIRVAILRKGFPAASLTADDLSGLQ